MDDTHLDSVNKDKDSRAYQVVGKDLLERIRAGEFRSSGKLPPERELAESYDVGRAVIRDALVMLEVKGMVQSRQGSGIYITRRAYEIESLESAGQSLRQLLPAGPFELVQARQWLESHMVRLAVKNMTPDDLVVIEQAFEDYRNAPWGGAKENLDMVFHLAIARATQNPELVGLISHLWHRRDGNVLWHKLHTRIVDTQYRERWALDHGKILEAIQRRDEDAAYVAMWQHLENVKNFLLELTDSPGERPEVKPASKRRKKMDV